VADAGLTREDWLERVPDLVEACREEWGLTLGKPYAGANVSVVIPAGDAVLKVQYPHRESEHEAAALERWNGDGAVRLLAHDPERHALLIERCKPGTHLAAALKPQEALGVLIELLPRLWKPAGGEFRPLEEEAGWWLESSADWPVDEQLREAAEQALRDLASTQGEQVLLHQDLHGDNVLSAQREPWLTIDPKPLAGEREFGLASIIRSFEFGHSRDEVVGRLDRLSSELSLDRDRAQRWAIAQTVAWTSDSAYANTHIETAHWLLQAE
jgi:streptomycin 6-kinase